MKNISKTKKFLEAAVVIAIALALVLPSSAVITSSTTETKKGESRLYKTEVNKGLSKPGLLLEGEDVCITGDNPDEDDQIPKIAVNYDGKIVVTYEQDKDDGSTSTPLVFSEDDGASWMMAYDIDSYGFADFGGSGTTQGVDIKYCQISDEFFWMAIDELADTPFQLMLRLPSEFPGEISIMGMTGTNAGAYYESAVGYVGDWFLAGAIFDLDALVRIPSIGYNDEFWQQPPTLPQNSFYYDGQSILKTENAYNYEIATGANRIFMVMDHLNDTSGDQEIAYKATYADLDPNSETFLFTPGGGPGGMDKYADIEVWPFQMYLAHNATDPDVSAKGSTVAVVYEKEGDVICSYSSDDGDTFGTSVVATDAGFPSVYVASEEIYCAYVKDGNISLVTSTDGGATWGTPQQINDEDGTVVEAPGTVELGAMGIVWTDSRNGANDIYFEYAEIDPPIPEPDLEITVESGIGLGVSAIIKNTGDAPATNVVWNIKVTGGILGLIDVDANDTIASLAIGGEETVNTGIFFGLGAIDITVTAECDESLSVTGNADGTQIIIFTVVN